jgi:hypothetical protein
VLCPYRLARQPQRASRVPQRGLQTTIARMKNVLVAVGCMGGAAALGGAPPPAPRELQTIQLCSTATQSSPALISTRCDLAAGPTLGAKWDTCCSYGAQSPEPCHTYTMAGSFCATCDLNGEGKCSSLSASGCSSSRPRRATRRAAGRPRASAIRSASRSAA